MAANVNYDWSGLYADLLVEIARRVKSYADFISFGLVCTSWRSVAVLENFRYKTNMIPWLMLPPKKDEEKDCVDQCSFFSLSTGMIRHVIMPQVDTTKYYSSRGWLIRLDPDANVNLLHPFSRAELKFPPISTAEYWKDGETVFEVAISKCVFSPDSQVLMAIYGGTRKLAYTRPGDEDWTSVKPWDCSCLDVIYYKDQFYAINYFGQIFAIKGNISHQIAELPNELKPPLVEYLYLVELDGALLVVSREGVQITPVHEDSEEYSYGTSGFQVFKLDLNSGKWEEVNNLGGRSLFLGHNSSFSFDASNDPYCKPNCIYFTDDFVESYTYMYEEENAEGGGKDMGIYVMEDESIKPHYKGSSYHHFNPPMWVEQSF